MIFRTRFAPSPTGPLHLGHAYSALLAQDKARANNGHFHLRMDDIDQNRARAHWVDQIVEDLMWLGVTWYGPIWFQNARSKQYRSALQRLWDLGLLYSCTCTRKDIKEAANAPQEGAPLIGPDGLVYPGTCRAEQFGSLPEHTVLRLNIYKSLKIFGIGEISFMDGKQHHTKSADQITSEIGDIVVARKDMAASYHLSIVVDDADQKITQIIRGEDLRDATFIHILLQKVLGFETPTYQHHGLIRDDAGKRLAKRDDARAIAKFREDGMSPMDVRRLVGL